MANTSLLELLNVGASSSAFIIVCGRGTTGERRKERRRLRFRERGQRDCPLPILSKSVCHGTSVIVKVPHEFGPIAVALQTCRQDQFYLFFFFFLNRLHLFFFARTTKELHVVLHPCHHCRVCKCRHVFTPPRQRRARRRCLFHHRQQSSGGCSGRSGWLGRDGH